MTLQLCGFAASNYYNKVKIALLEKGVPFEEVVAFTPLAADLLTDSPMGKVPFLRTPQGPLAESQVIVEYLEEAFPAVPLYPADPFARAKVREIVSLIELHVELVMRRLYGATLFGATPPEGLFAEVEPLLRRGCAALARRASFGAFLAGDAFSIADCAAAVHLPLLSTVSRSAYGKDFAAEYFPEAREYLSRIGQRPAVARTNADRKASLEAFMAHRKAQYAK